MPINIINCKYDVLKIYIWTITRCEYWPWDPIRWGDDCGWLQYVGWTHKFLCRAFWDGDELHFEDYRHFGGSVFIDSLIERCSSRDRSEVHQFGGFLLTLLVATLFRLLETTKITQFSNNQNLLLFIENPLLTRFPNKLETKNRSF